MTCVVFLALWEQFSNFRCIRGMLENADGNCLYLYRRGVEEKQLHPVDAVRYVMAAVHALTAAHDTATVRATGLKVPAPGLEVLVSACEIADCWECPSVVAAAAQSVAEAARIDASKEMRYSSLIKLLRLVPSTPAAVRRGRTGSRCAAPSRSH